VQRFNLFHGELEDTQDVGPFRGRGTRVADHIGAETIGGSLYELPAGTRIFPYHFHWTNEEWLIVVDGEPTLRTPEGSRQLRRGDVVAFPAGPAGAHDLTGPGRVLLLSTLRLPEIPVYPDSDKIGTRPGGDEDRLNFIRSTAVDYWEGEL
jgi:uncharacterized cupin superfamily protein